MANVSIPTAADEAADPVAADLIYEACTKLPISKTRDRRRFPLVFEENVNYGFRRNLWGMRPAGFAISAIATSAAAVALIANSEGPLALAWFIVLLANASFLAWWAFRINSDWVFIPAKAYAERLMETLDSP